MGRGRGAVGRFDAAGAAPAAAAASSKLPELSECAARRGAAATGRRDADQPALVRPAGWTRTGQRLATGHSGLADLSCDRQEARCAAADRRQLGRAARSDSEIAADAAAITAGPAQRRTALTGAESVVFSREQICSRRTPAGHAKPTDSYY